jgi:nitroreductase
MLDAARLAPSAENSQPWRFIIVRDQVMKEILAEAASVAELLSSRSQHFQLETAADLKM